MSYTPARRKSLFFCFLLWAFTGMAQFYPAAGNRLNFTSVCFEYPWMNRAASYEITLLNETTAKKTTYKSESNKLIVDDLDFDTRYSWKVAALDTRGKPVSMSAEIPFSIETHFHLSDEYIHFREVTNDKEKRGTELLIFDYCQLAVNHDLKPVWYLPKLAFMKKDSGIRDLKITADGTFVAIIDSNAYELSRTGKVLWKAPNNGKVSKGRGEDYHHDIQKLPSGNFMVLGNEIEYRQLTAGGDSVKFQIGTVIEYSPKGKVIWEWHAKDFFTNELLMLRKRADGSYETATHMNSFNVSGNAIFVGFRDASWILKIDKTTKQVTEIYGGPDSGLPAHYAKGLFRFQHDSHVLKNGSIAIINNDSIKDPAVYSSLLIFSQGEENFRKGEERFRFYFNYDTLTNGKSLKLGNVNELSNGNYLVNMGALNRIFELTPGGEIVWDVLIDKLDTLKNTWRPFPQYRVATATSLYPNEFAVKWDPGTAKGDNLNGKLRLYNVGSEANSYSVVAEKRDGTSQLLAALPVVLPGQSTEKLVAIPRELLSGEVRLLVRVNGKSHFEVLEVRTW